ncbi:hypothetical protein HPB47_009991 [Ixodes persulcatus]|uniref:Uncharacterized protein n=1 Tax=Ixodes persulcatus TaxID=34615 RepID=A0AC60P0E7_IXOPE|nr:hypothetical protein HPB47_009991 [Ixodes persulcatus]
MNSSSGAALSAPASRGFLYFDVEDVPTDYRVVLPPLPRGIVVLNSVFFHCDVTARPYRIEDFRDSLGTAGVLEDIVSFGSFQMNHLWIMTLKTTEAKRRLLALNRLCIKDKACFLLDPNKAEVRLEVHWLPHHVSDETVRRALEGYGKVEEVTRDFWRVKGFEGVESTTRIVRMTLGSGTTLESLQHQLQLPGGTALVVVPGRAPMCLRCRRAGHVRKNCTAPKCLKCHNFGHTADECVRIYANATSRGPLSPANDMVMDEVEAEETSQSGAAGLPGTAVDASGLPGRTEAREQARNGSVNAEKEIVPGLLPLPPAAIETPILPAAAAAVAPSVSGSILPAPTAVAMSPDAVVAASVTRRFYEPKSPAVVQRWSSTASLKSVDMVDQVGLATKRSLELEARGPVQSVPVSFKQKGCYDQAPRIPQDDRRRSK